MTRILVLLSLGFSVAAFADENPCHITKNLTLTADSNAHCIDFRVDPGVVVQTGDFQFVRNVDGQTILGEPGRPAKLIGNVDVTTFSLGGQLIGEAVNGVMNIVTSGYNSRYAQSLKAGAGGFVSVMRQGMDVTKDESNFGGIN